MHRFLRSKSRLAPSLLLCLLAACGGGGGGSDPPAATGTARTLARVSPLASGAACATGGVQVQAGTDANGNGLLDAAEVSTTASACNGAGGSAGATALARVEAEAAGAACAAGGTRVLSGVDANGNGTLDDAEISGRSTLCRGTEGRAGAPRLATLTSLPAGGDCAAGGSRYAGGADANGNGVLDEAEVTELQTVCNGTAGAGASTQVGLLAVAPEPAGTACPAGGQRLQAGLDANGNGVLDPVEIRGSSVVCTGATGGSGAAGAAGADALMLLASEAPGARCAAGGSRLDGGVDGNGNGQLDGDEVTSIRYLCNGLDGAAPAARSLLAVAAEAPGATCAAGGRRIDSGVDTNGNGVLDAAEVASTGYVCDGRAGAAGTAGLSSLVRVQAAAGGCAESGQDVASGLDANGNGVLDADEVASVERVCNGSSGAAGAAGSSGLAGLVDVRAETAGLQCSFGGSLIRAGLDANRNGVLDDAEVGATRFLCQGAAGASFRWTEVGAPTVQAASNQGYLARNEDTPVVLTLPPSPAPGDVVKLTGAAGGGWVVAQNAGQRVVTRPAGDAAVGNTSLGQTWNAAAVTERWQSAAMSNDGRRIVAVPQTGPLYTSSDGGLSWTARTPSRQWFRVAASADGLRLAAASYHGQIYTSADGGSTWTGRETARRWTGLASSADGRRLLASEGPGLLYTSSDGGASWTPRDSERAWQSVSSSADGLRLLAADQGGALYTSVDGGVSWAARGVTGVWQGTASSADGLRLAAVALGARIQVSGDGGDTWTARGPLQNWVSVAMSADGQRLLAGDDNGGVWQSIDGGAVWELKASLPFYAAALALSGEGADAVAGGIDSMLFRSSAVRGVAFTTSGSAGGLRGGRGSTVELQSLGGGEFLLRSHLGTLFVD